MQQTFAQRQGNDTAPFRCPLPGEDEAWQASDIKAPHSWPPTLQALSVTLSTFEYPAAIFWGEDLVLLYNEGWSNAGGIRQQGQAQRGSLSSDAWLAISNCMDGGKPTVISSHALLREEEEEEGHGQRHGQRHEYTVFASPCFDNETRKPVGVLAQMMQVQPRQDSPPPEFVSHSQDVRTTEKGEEQDTSEQADNKEGPNMDRLGSHLDDVPLNKHPFFRKFAELLPTGLAILDHEAKAVFVNQHFYELTTHQGDDRSFKSWPQSIHPDDYQRVLGLYQEAFKSKEQVRTEFRALGKKHPWRLLLLTPLGDESLRHVSLAKYGGFICSIVDITSEKSAELSQRHAAEEATKRKQQQERFIDMISHEIRNPLSAVLHCVEDIDEAAKAGADDCGRVDIPQIMEALETINLCISHQKNIVDDVLSYSKLDSSMLALTPRPTQIDTQVRRSLKMFQAEFRKNSLEFEYCVDNGYTESELGWAMADFPRIGQVLINLISNAIKFTVRKDGERRITCRLSASEQRPTSYPPDVVFFSTDSQLARLDATDRIEWGEGKRSYVLLAISDTGIGISDKGQKRLFERFEQATPKTSEIYGGSGLGLNISRKLVHLHGGEIGVASIEGEGTTFGFFFRVRRCDGPSDMKQSDKDDDSDEQRFRSQINSRGMDSLSGQGAEESHATISNPEVKRTTDRDVSDDRTEHSGKLAGEHDRARNDREDRKQRNLQWQADRQKSVEEGAGQRAQKEKQDMKDKDGKQQADNSINGTAESRNADKDAKQKTHTLLPLRRRDDIDTSQPHVLLVEDNIINQRIVNRKLTTKGFHVSTANNGREAVDAFSASCGSSASQQDQFDIILMDQEMPVLDGNGAAKAIRELEGEQNRESRVPILGVSANVRDEQLEEMLGSGMDATMTKPYRIEDMVGKIGEMIGRTPQGRGQEANAQAAG